jgi:excinuclease UvrABC nuclease subunit
MKLDKFDALKHLEREEENYKVYFLLRNEEVIYIGQTINIRQRINSHSLEGRIDYDDVYYIECNENQHVNIVEAKYIKKYNPIYNRNKPNYCNNIFVDCCIDGKEEELFYL